MSITLQPEEVCQHSEDCKYNDTGQEWFCRGTKVRPNIFTCDLVTDKEIDKEKN